jgi:hypothetical protein
MTEISLVDENVVGEEENPSADDEGDDNNAAPGEVGGSIPLVTVEQPSEPCTPLFVQVKSLLF